MQSASPIIAAFQAPRGRSQNPIQTSPVSPPQLQPPQEAQPRLPTRTLQQVSTKQDGVKACKWMQEEIAKPDGEKLICSKVIAQFPCLFRGSKSANDMKAQRWFKDRLNILQEQASIDNVNSIQAKQVGLRKKVLLKACQGRGRMRALHTEWLHQELKEEFDRLRKAGMKFSPKILLMVAKKILADSVHEEYTSTFLIPPSKTKMFKDYIDIRWIQTFTDRFNIVPRLQTGKKSGCPEKIAFIEKEVAYHMAVFARGFGSGGFKEENMCNMDETHFIVNLDNGRTLGVRGDEEVKYADVVSGTTGMTMVVFMTGGVQSFVEPPMMIFINQNSNYPIRGVPDNIPGVSYRTAKKGFMTREVFAQCLKERRAIRPLPNGERMIIWLDNYGGHNVTEEQQAALNALNAELRFFPANATHLVQPADSFVISKIKDEWVARWEEKKNGTWSNTPRSDDSWSGALRNPGYCREAILFKTCC